MSSGFVPASRPVRGKLLLVLSFVLTLGAGVVVGMALNKPGIAGITAPTPPADPPRFSGDSWLKRELDLNPQQQEQMKAIWQQTMQGAGREMFDRQRSLDRERDEAVLALYTPDQRAAYDRLQNEHRTKIAELRKEREKLTQVAVEQTKAILNDAQRAKYDQLLRDRAERDRNRHRGPSTRPGSTQPFGGSPSFGDGFGPGGPDGRRDHRRGDGSSSSPGSPGGMNDPKR